MRNMGEGLHAANRFYVHEKVRTSSPYAPRRLKMGQRLERRRWAVGPLVNASANR